MGLADYFTNKNPRKVWILTDDAPRWLRDEIYRLHFGGLPNDWIYEKALEACSAIDDGALDEDSVLEWADSSVDVYNGDLLQWIADNHGSGIVSEAEECYEDYGPQGIVDGVRILQMCAIQIIAEGILSAMSRGDGYE